MKELWQVLEIEDQWKHTSGVLPLESPILGSNPALRSSSRKAALPVLATVSKFIDRSWLPSSSPPSKNRSPSLKSLRFLWCCSQHVLYRVKLLQSNLNDFFKKMFPAQKARWLRENKGPIGSATKEKNQRKSFLFQKEDRNWWLDKTPEENF